MTEDEDIARCFPENAMRALFGQIAAWTSIRSIHSAAALLESPTMAPTPAMFLVYPDHPLLEAVFVRLFTYIVPSFRCPPTKLAIARRLDGRTTAATYQRLADARFNPTISVGGHAAVERMAPHLATRGPSRLCEIRDEPFMIELVFEPLQMLRTLTVALFESAADVHRIQRGSTRTTSSGAGPTVVHRPYGDGPLAATLDAYIYFAFGFRVGIQWPEDVHSLDLGTRCRNLTGTPPFPQELFDVALESFADLNAELRRP